jgi:hypothetical protein
MARVLGIDVDRELVDQWAQWLAPPVQPFFVESLRGWPRSAGGELIPELRDTYRLWRVNRSLKTLWLDEDTFFALDRTRRGELVRAQVRARRGAVPTVRAWSDLLDPATLRAQADGHRFVWWPSLVTDAVVHRTVETESLPSRHREVGAATWKACAALLPRARSLAGTFAPASADLDESRVAQGAVSCFTTTMAAAGINDSNMRMLQEPFEQWLSENSRPRRRGDELGTVYVWRDASGLATHSAAAIGGGWALEKPSQCWYTPRRVLRVDEMIRNARQLGERVERHRLVG